MAFYLEANEPIPSEIRRILLEQVEYIVQNLTSPEIDPEIGVHEARKTCKRMRAVYRLIRDEIGDELYHQENLRFRDTARLLAGARDSWVMGQTFDQLVGEIPAIVSDSDEAKIRENLLVLYEIVLAAEQDDQAKTAAILDDMQQAAAKIHQLSLHQDDFLALSVGLRRVYKRGRRAMGLAASQPSSENFHEWRKQVKYLWHQVEILQPTRPDELLPLAEKLHTLSDYLGAEHDLAVLQETIEANPLWLPDQIMREILLHAITQKRDGLQAEAQLLGAALYADTDLSFTRRVETYWFAWRSETR